MGLGGSKCQFTGSNAMPCKNPPRDGVYKFCHGHKCRECASAILDTGYHYCHA